MPPRYRFAPSPTGALVAARWIVGRQGVFTLADVLADSAAGVA